MGGYRCAVMLAVMFLLNPQLRCNYVEAGDQEKPEFEIVSIKPGSSKYDGSGAHETDLKFLPGGRFVTTHSNLQNLISYAYEVPYLQVLGIPKFIEKADWNIEARPQEGKYPLNNGLLDPYLGNLMIQRMLDERFKLKVHKETRVVPGYELVVAKGGTRGLKLSVEQTKPLLGAIMPGSIIAPSTSLSQLASVLTTHFNLWEGDKKRIQVVNKTGLEGLYSIKLHWTPDRSRVPAWQKPSADKPEVTLFDAIQDQLGLTLKPADLPLSVIVVDDVQMPGMN